MSTRVLAVDIGGTSIKMALVEVGDRPQILATEFIEDHAREDPNRVLADVADRLRSLVADGGSPAPVGVGIGSAGLIRGDEGVVVTSPNLPAWEGTAVGPILARTMSLPVRMDNDVNAFTLAEWRWGAGAGARNVVFLTLGTGIGGGFVVDGRLVRGAQGFAGEPGHATLVLDGIPCSCGNRGCAERYIGNNDIVRIAREHPNFKSDPDLASTERLTPRLIDAAADRGSVVAQEVLATAGRALGGLLVSLVNIFNPERVVIGGGVAQAGSWILDPAREHLAVHSLVARNSPPEIRPAALGRNAGLLGAAALVVEEDSADSL